VGGEPRSGGGGRRGGLRHRVQEDEKHCAQKVMGEVGSSCRRAQLRMEGEAMY
jgi:hypothetical protein